VLRLVFGRQHDCQHAQGLRTVARVFAPHVPASAEAGPVVIVDLPVLLIVMGLSLSCLGGRVIAADAHPSRERTRTVAMPFTGALRRPKSQAALRSAQAALSILGSCKRSPLA